MSDTHRVTTQILEAVEAFYGFCYGYDEDQDYWDRRDAYEAKIELLPDGAEEIVQDLYHHRWLPPGDDPLYVAALHARKGLPWRCYVPAEVGGEAR